jgi:hypothetical protein
MPGNDPVYNKLYARAVTKAKNDAGDAGEELLTILSLHSKDIIPLLKPEEREQMNSIKLRIQMRNEPYVDPKVLTQEREKYRQKIDEGETLDA